MAAPTAQTPFDTTYPGELSYKDLTILNGASLSDAIDLGRTSPVSLGIPASWTTAVISFAVSYDGTNYYPLYNAAGEVASTTAFTGSAVLSLSPLDFAGVRYLKVRSGTVGSAVAQGGDRVVRVITRIL